MGRKMLVTAALEQLCRFSSDDVGASLIEYSLLVAMISVAILTAITAISGNIGTIWSDLASIIAFATNG